MIGQHSRDPIISVDIFGLWCNYLISHGITLIEHKLRVRNRLNRRGGPGQWQASDCHARGRLSRFASRRACQHCRRAIPQLPHRKLDMMIVF